MVVVPAHDGMFLRILGIERPILQHTVFSDSVRQAQGRDDNLQFIIPPNGNVILLQSNNLIM